FGRRLADQPLMANVLADLCVESEAATLASFRLARAFDEATRSEQAGPFQRLATPVVKYWVAKRNAPHAAEALEALGGNGYVEESPMPRLLRDSPLNSIWEGSGNVIALDVLRAFSKEPGSFGSLLIEAERAKGLDERFDRALDEAEAAMGIAAGADSPFLPSEARRLVERIALLLQASLVLRHSPDF